MNENTILVVEDDPHLKHALVCALESAGHVVLAAGDGGEALELLGGASVDLIVTDVQMAPVDGRELLRSVRRTHPHLPVVMMTAYGTIEQAVAAMRDGAVDYLVKPFEADELERRVARYLTPAAAAASAAHGAANAARAEPASRARVDARAAREREPSPAGARADDGGPVAVDPRSRRLLDLAEKVAASDVTVLLTGESGTGKEVLARFIHRRSPRAAKPFVAVNCAALPASMLEALLFGHEKGAFTGAQQRADGKFVQADGGTLLLDEITEMELGLQAKLLRVLQEREVEPLGARAPIPLDVRVLATSNRDLDDAVREGVFREDLYYRLSVFPLEIPPLRERRADIVPLAERFLARHARGGRVPELSARAAEALERCGWPGNVRQLDNVIQRALVLAGGGACIDEDHLVLDEQSKEPAAGLAAELWEEEARRIVGALRDSAGSRKRAAERLGISARTLRYKLAKLRAAGFALPGDRGASAA